MTLPGGATKAWCAAPEDGFLVTSGVVNQVRAVSKVARFACKTRGMRAHCDAALSPVAYVLLLIMYVWFYS